jgi:ribosomal protein L11 methyltransferase
MEWMEVCVFYQYYDSELASDLIADVFYDLGLKGVVLNIFQDKDLKIHNEQSNVDSYNSNVIGYFRLNESFKKTKKCFEKNVAALCLAVGIKYSIYYQKTDEEDWSESWKKYYWPEKIGERIVVKPTWREYITQSGELVVNLDPGMSFGTGSHPTTALCIKMLEKYVKNKDCLLDVGTGSGILMITSYLLGAKELYGVDNDVEAVNIARKNLLLNRVNEKDFTLYVGNLIENINKKFDIIVSNILLFPVIELLNKIYLVLKNRGTIILSGFLQENLNMVTDKLLKEGFTIIEIESHKKWSCVVAATLKSQVVTKN